MPEHKS